jgi:hypothetical protein
MSDITASLIMAAPLLIERKNHNEFFHAVKNLYLKGNEIVCGLRGSGVAGCGYGQTKLHATLPPSARPA